MSTENTEQIKKCDRRVVKTKRAIRNAFIKLLAEKDVNDISIKNIADEADVDRKTLYNYYNNIYEIREELENELICLLDQAIQEIDLRKNINNPQHIFEILTSLINSNLDLYSNLMKINANSHIIRKIYSVVKDRLRYVIEENNLMNEPENLDLCVDFITAGMISVYQTWFNSDQRRPINEVSKEVGRMVLFGLKDFTKH